MSKILKPELVKKAIYILRFIEKLGKYNKKYIRYIQDEGIYCGKGKQCYLNLYISKID